MHTEVWIGLILFGIVLIIAGVWSVKLVNRQHARAYEILSRSTKQQLKADEQQKKADEQQRREAELLTRWEAVVTRLEAMASRWESRNDSSS